jgi:hypothetical protein
MALDNANFDWYTGSAPKVYPGGIENNQIDLQTVWLHEFGHGLGLGHSNETGSVMEAIYDGPRRDLISDDIAGITSLYPSSTVNLPPTVTITTPADGTTFVLDTGNTVKNIDFTATATDDDATDEYMASTLIWTYDDDLPLGDGVSSSKSFSVGSYVIKATATDTDGVKGSDSVGVTVIVPGEGNSNDSYVWAIDFSERRKGRGGSLVDLTTTVTIRRDSNISSSADNNDELVGGANVQMTLARDGNSFDFSGTTNSEGMARFTLQHALIGTPYTANVTSVPHSTYTYNNLLNVENNVEHTISP